MPITMRVQYAEVDGRTYVVCSICGILSMMGQAYGPCKMVYGPDHDPSDNNNKMSLCYGCYMEQFVAEYPDTPLPIIIDGRVYPVEAITVSNLVDIVKAGAGVVGKNETEYQKWERALYQAKASGESVEQVYNKLYYNRPVEAVGMEPA